MAKVIMAFILGLIVGTLVTLYVYDPEFIMNLLALKKFDSIQTLVKSPGRYEGEEVYIRGTGAIKNRLEETGSEGVLYDPTGKYFVFVTYDARIYNPCASGHALFQVKGTFVGVESGYPTIEANDVEYMGCFNE